ncbi:intradiol ring-cleavage dioxygenase [Sphingomonas sp. DT-51]|uniref:dioxygenase family protein n=1 Tax=Sphingomonas sp. DT-51 TaxID=3396165 RepID=UPI003F1DAA6C
MHDHDQHNHDLGLAHDLRMMKRTIERRHALRWFAGAGTLALVAGCGSGSGDAASDTASASPTPTPSPTPSPTATNDSGTATCVLDASETGGPYPADGTNLSSGSTANVLTAAGIVRGDVRASFLGTTTIATGVPVTLTLTLVDVNQACAPLAGYALYLWHCDRQGLYSLYTVPAESYLRGVQVTDANGQVTFITIFPGCYDGRWPHIHFEVFSSLANALGGRYAILTSQLALPSSTCSIVYADSATYPSSASNFRRVALSSDNVFGDNTAAQNAQMTPSFSGTPTAGFTATAVIGIAR